MAPAMFGRHRGTGFAGPQVSPPARGKAKRHEVRVAWGSAYILQPRAGSARPLIAVLTSLFSLPSTLRR